MAPMRSWIRGIVAFCLAWLVATPARAGDDAKLAAAAARARDIANRLQAALDPDQCRSVTFCRVTTAAGILDNGKVIIATSEPGSRLRSPLLAIRDAEGADVADGSGDAEHKIINFVQSSLFHRSRKLLVVAAGRPICEQCERELLAAGARPASACKSGRRY